jgi:hypothetical protein
MYSGAAFDIESCGTSKATPADTESTQYIHARRNQRSAILLICRRSPSLASDWGETGHAFALRKESRIHAAEVLQDRPCEESSSHNHRRTGL